MVYDSSISNHHLKSAGPCVSALAFARSFLFNMACLCLLHRTAQRSVGTPSLLFRDYTATKQIIVRMHNSQVSALVTPVCSMQQPWLQDILVCLQAVAHSDLLLTSRITWTTSSLMNKTSNMSSPASKSTGTHSKSASVDSKCTTMSDIIKALDDAHDRIASMGADELKRERVDSVDSLKAVDHPKWMKPIKAFDQKKYLDKLEAGDITLRQIQVAANLTKLLPTPPSCLRSTLLITSALTALPGPKYGPGKCTYDAYPLPPKHKRDAVSDNIEDALKKVKRVGGRSSPCPSRMSLMTEMYGSFSFSPSEYRHCAKMHSATRAMTSKHWQVLSHSQTTLLDDESIATHSKSYIIMKDKKKQNRF
ncbi:hypothetical protein KCU65_g4274, partial [Aureobasidium melanogenum]